MNVNGTPSSSTPSSPSAAFELEVFSGSPPSPQASNAAQPARGLKYCKLKFSGF